MTSTLIISDLSATKTIDAKAMGAVRGGADDQAIGVSQANVQNMVSAANVGNASLFLGPANIQSDNTFTQNAANHSSASNVSALGIFGLGFGRMALPL